MHDNPEKFKQLIAEKEQELAKEVKKTEESKKEEKHVEGEEGTDPVTQGSVRSKLSAKPKEKRAPMEK